MIFDPNTIIATKSVVDMIKFTVAVRVLRIRSVIPVQTYVAIGHCGSLGGLVGYGLKHGNTPWR